MGPLAPVIGSILQELTEGVKEKCSVLQSRWPEIVGNVFSSHTQPELQSRATLCVWVDDSNLAAELNQRYLGTILKRAQGVLGEESVQKIIFRVGAPR